MGNLAQNAEALRVAKGLISFVCAATPPQSCGAMEGYPHGTGVELLNDSEMAASKK